MTAYELAGIRLTRQGDKFAVTKDGKPVHGSPYENPLEAGVRFMDLANIRLIRRIGNYLESQGKNRYTGEIIPPEAPRGQGYKTACIICDETETERTNTR